MNPTGYMILGYTVGTVILWGYALWLWVSLRHSRRRQP